MWRALMALLLCLPAGALAAEAPLPPGRVVLPGGGEVALYLSADWNRPQPAITRAVIVMHGLGRDGLGYFRAGLEARARAGAEASALIIAPRIVGSHEAEGLGAGPQMLRWRGGRWSGGGQALGPHGVSSFAIFDAIIARLADRGRFPALRAIVIAGHSAGGQIVQRYAAVHHPWPELARAGIGVSFVVANPSSYLYFDAWRPQPVAGCARYNEWKYGFAAQVIGYVRSPAAALAARYRREKVTYLLGGRDNDPHHDALDQSCMGEAEGPNRLARGQAYFRHLLAGGAAPRQRLFVVPGVAHSGRRMFVSACGLAALFDTPGCK